MVNAFVSLVREYDRNRYEFSLRETSTAGIIDDVRVQRSELGVLYRCDFNESVISNVVKSADLHFVPLFRAKPHVFVSRNSPLAHLERVTLADLAPYPRLSYDQGIRNSLYYAEELHIAEAVDKSIWSWGTSNVPTGRCPRSPSATCSCCRSMSTNTSAKPANKGKAQGAPHTANPTARQAKRQRKPQGGAHGAACRRPTTRAKPQPASIHFSYT